MAHALRAPRQPRRWVRRLLIGLNIFLAVCIVLTGTSYVYVKYRFGQIDKINFVKGVLERDGEDEPGLPMNVLLVGSDSRKNIERTEQGEFGSTSDVGGQRSDTIMVLHIDPRTKYAAILSIPRDLWVPIDGTKGRQRINTAFEHSPERLIRTITNSLGIDIHHYVDVDFVGFREIVKAVGGVKVYFAAPARDRLSKLEVPRAGCIKLSADQALAYVRSRHYQSYESGRWRTDPTSDFGRIQRQQDFIRRTIRAAIARGIRNPVVLNRLVGNTVENLTIDDKLSTKDITNLGKRFKSLGAEDVEMLTLPTDPTRIGGADVLILREDEAQQIIDRFNGKVDEPDSVPLDIIPGEVRVRVLNGSGTGGQAGSVALALQDFGYGIDSTGDADKFTYVANVVRYAKGQRDKALLVKAYIEGKTTLEEDSDLVGTDVVLVTGSAFKGVRAPNTVSSTTSSSTPPVSAKPQGAPKTPVC